MGQDASFFANNPELVAPFRAGEREALEKVYRAHVRGVERYMHSLSRRAGGWELVQTAALADLLQDIFIRAFSVQARQAYDGVRDYQRYLNTIAYHCFIDVLRSRGREVFKATEDLGPDDIPSCDPEPCSDPRVRLVLTEYLARLPPQLKGVYEQRFVLGRSQHEASSALRLTRRQLRTAEEHLRSGLRRALQSAGVSAGRGTDSTSTAKAAVRA